MSHPSHLSTTYANNVGQNRLNWPLSEKCSSVAAVVRLVEIWFPDGPWGRLELLSNCPKTVMFGMNNKCVDAFTFTIVQHPFMRSGSVVQSVIQLISQLGSWVGQSVSQLFRQSVSQFVIQYICQLVSGSVSWLAHQLNSWSVIQLVNSLLGQSVNWSLSSSISKFFGS